MQTTYESMSWYHWLGGFLGSGVGIAFVVWLVKYLIERFFKKTDKKEEKLEELEGEREKRQNNRILKCEERLDAIDIRLQSVDRLEGRLLTRDKADELIAAEKESREQKDADQDKHIDRLLKRVFGNGGL